MTVIRVGVQSPAGGAGQLVDMDGPSATISSITNASGESVQYSIDGGGVWVPVASGASSGSIGTVLAGLLRMRKVSSGAYPAPVDVDASINGLYDGGLTVSQIASVTAAQSGEALAITLDGSNRLATMTNGATGRVATVTYADSTHLTISDNRTPQAVGTLVLDAGGRLVSYSGNF